MNQAYWGAFWSNSYTDWDEITCIDCTVHGLQLDWSRFTSMQCVDFIRHEISAIRAGGSDRPVTTNMMGFSPSLDYWQQVPALDIVSYDAYPQWHGERPDREVACRTASEYAIYQGMMGGDPWLLLESTPSNVNWTSVSRPKRPGMQRLAALQAVAHGSTSVMYFQWRKGRGAAEKFHGALVDHVGHEHTRVFQEAIEVGEELKTLSCLADSRSVSEVAIICDWEIRWAIENARLSRNSNKDYIETVQSFYKPFWTRGVGVELIDSVTDFSRYKILVAPMLYMLRPGVAERLQVFVEQGGHLICSYLTGLVDDNDLCFTSGFPGPLRSLLGIWVEETDTPDTSAGMSVTAVENNELGLTGSYAAREFCDVIHLEAGKALSRYVGDYYAGTPALTVNTVGRGRAYYVASRNDERFQSDLIGGVLRQAGVNGALTEPLPTGVSAVLREDDHHRYLFLMNFETMPANVTLPTDGYRRVSDGVSVDQVVSLTSYGCEVLEEPVAIARTRRTRARTS